MIKKENGKEYNYIQQYMESNPIYEQIKFSNTYLKKESSIHPVLQASQAIIDKYISMGQNRIVLILPDENTNVMPLFITKYFLNVQERPDYTHSLFDDICEGQHLKLGKAVVEFLNYDSKEGIIELNIGRASKTSTPYKNTTSISDYMMFFEKSNAALTAEKTFKDEKKRIKTQLEDGIVDLELLKTKRTVLNKSYLILSVKNELMDYLSELKVSKNSFTDVVTYGEINNDTKQGYTICNLGQLDCLPAFLISSRINDLRILLENDSFNGNAEAVIVMPNKVQELISNTRELKNCLKTNVPMIVFAFESDYEIFPMLDEFGFEFWRWSPEYLHGNGLSSYEYVQEEGSLFSSFSKKIYNFSYCEINNRIIKDSYMSDGIKKVRLLLKNVDSMPMSSRSILFELYKTGKMLFDIASPIGFELLSDLLAKINELKDRWLKEKKYWENTEIENEIEEVFKFIENAINIRRLAKADALDGLIKNSNDNTIAIVLPQRYKYEKLLNDRALQIWRGKKVKVYKAGEFIRKCRNNDIFFDHVIVTFFDNADFISIRNTFCYKKITYLLYDFENYWKTSHINRINNSLPLERMKKNAKHFGVTEKIITKTETVEDDANKGSVVLDYNFERNVIKELISKNNNALSQNESMECVPILFELNVVGYFLPNHSMIDITDLCIGYSEKPVGIEAREIKRGNIILVRKSERDIIREKADELMVNAQKTNLRNKSELWIEALRSLNEKYSIEEICKLLNDNGGDCDILQVRYWLDGDTICPEKVGVLRAISALASDIMKEQDIGEVYNSGKEVQEYHRKAGRWLTAELKQKAKEIMNIYSSGNREGYLEGIGEIAIYVVEDILEKEYVNRTKINKFEEIL